MAPQPDLHQKVLSLVERKKKADADLGTALGRVAVAGGPGPGASDTSVPPGSPVTLVVDSRNVAIGLALNGRVLVHPGLPQFSVPVVPLVPGNNALLIALYATDTPWAFEVQLLANGSVIARAADQGTVTGPTPTSPITWNITVS